MDFMGQNVIAYEEKGKYKTEGKMILFTKVQYKEFGGEEWYNEDNYGMEFRNAGSNSFEVYMEDDEMWVKFEK